jgi:glycosyltransferase involved in cell wall biosynthesis
LLVPPGDPAAIADALRTILADGALRARLGAAGRARAERYRWETVVAEIERAYRDAIARAGRAEGR